MTTLGLRNELQLQVVKKLEILSQPFQVCLADVGRVEVGPAHVEIVHA